MDSFVVSSKPNVSAPTVLKVTMEFLAAQSSWPYVFETKVEPMKSLMAHGIQSLVALGLRNGVRSELGAALLPLRNLPEGGVDIRASDFAMDGN